jgi:hypothetical protein
VWIWVNKYEWKSIYAVVRIYMKLCEFIWMKINLYCSMNTCEFIWIIQYEDKLIYTYTSRKESTEFVWIYMNEN